MAKKSTKDKKKSTKVVKKHLFRVEAGVEYTNVYDVVAESKAEAKKAILRGQQAIFEHYFVRFLEPEDWNTEDKGEI